MVLVSSTKQKQSISFSRVIHPVLCSHLFPDTERVSGDAKALLYVLLCADTFFSAKIEQDPRPFSAGEQLCGGCDFVQVLTLVFTSIFNFPDKNPD